MKKIIIVIVALFITTNVFSQGITFENGTFTEALAKAKKENKMVFMDCYTIWCGPCKILSNDVFPKKIVGDYFNSNFVSIKIDMEKGEGIELRKKYDVVAFPTLLFIDEKGEVVHNFAGGLEAEELIAEAKISQNPNKRLSGLMERYKKGERSLDFIVNYLDVLYYATMDKELVDVANEFIANASLDKLGTIELYDVLSSAKLKYKGRIFNYLINNKLSVIENIGEEKYDYIMEEAIRNHLNSQLKFKSLVEFTDKIEECKEEYVCLNQEMLEFELISDYYLLHKEYVNWFDYQKSVADILIKKDKISAVEIYLNTAFQVAEDSNFKGAGLDGKAIDLLLKLQECCPSDLDSYYGLAILYKKSGNKEKAQKNIQFFVQKLSEKGEELGEAIIKLEKEIESMV